jgi:hypothetical protein
VLITVLNFDNTVLIPVIVTVRLFSRPNLSLRLQRNLYYSNSIRNPFSFIIHIYSKIAWTTSNYFTTWTICWQNICSIGIMIFKKRGGGVLIAKYLQEMCYRVKDFYVQDRRLSDSLGETDRSTWDTYSRQPLVCLGVRLYPIQCSLVNLDTLAPGKIVRINEMFG